MCDCDLKANVYSVAIDIKEGKGFLLSWLLILEQNLKNKKSSFLFGKLLGVKLYYLITFKGLK